MYRLATFLLAWLAPSACAGPARESQTSQEPSAQAAEVQRGIADERPPSPALEPADQDTLELIREAIQANDRAGARELLTEEAAALKDPEPGGEAAHVSLLLELDRLANELGSLDESRRFCEALLAIRQKILPSDHPDLLRARQNLARTLFRLRDIAGAHDLFEEVLAAQTRLLPQDHPDLLTAKGNLAVTRKKLGDLASARELEEEVLAARTRLLPTDHPHLLAAKQNLGVTRYELRDFAGARELFEEVLAAQTRLLPTDHPELLAVKGNVAMVRIDLGDLAGARELFEEVLAARMRLLPPDHPDLLRAKVNLAGALYKLLDLAGAHNLFEEVLAAQTRLLPPDHPDLLLTKQGLALTRRDLGDIAGAHELFEDVLAAQTRLLPPDHPDLLLAKQNLAMTRSDLGDIAGARELEEEVLEARTRLLSPDHPDLLAAKQNLALTRRNLGDLAGARELEEEVLEARTRLLPPDHPDLLAAKQNLALTRRELGDIAGRRELEEEVLEARTRLLPPDHPDLLAAKQNLAGTRRELGDLAGARELVSSLLTGMRARARGLHADAARPAREGARAELRRLDEALFLSQGSGGTLERELFATLEQLRLASVASFESAHALGAHPELVELVRSIAEQRARLNDRVAAGAVEAESAEDWRRQVLTFAEERDRAERELRTKLAAAGVFVGEIEATELGRRLAQGTAAVSFLRYRKEFDKNPETGEKPPVVDSLLAFVVKPGGAVARVELGPAAELETLAQDWRAALGRPPQGRGIGVSDAGSTEERLDTLGRRLRERVLDPLLAQLGDVHALHVELDDVLHLVPLDALPLEEGLVGERIAIHDEVTLARLLREGTAFESEGELLLAGGLDYDAELGEGSRVRLDASTPPLSSERSGPGTMGFTFLSGTLAESESISTLYEGAFEREAVLLSGADGTKAAFFAAAPRARFLHLATHGWFASEVFKSQLDTLAEKSVRESWQRAEETLTGFAPETLCGLALAGANGGRDAVGRVAGILTAEELASFDLRNCELAVLSACETNVGIRRAGQGIQSLQTALHAAGARTAITSLWKVDDAATRRLFELFYTKLWKEKLGKADALWQAKMALRAEGHPPRDWAGWILSGDPE